MPFRNLGQFLDALRADSDLRVIDAEVDPEYELGEIAQRAVREEKPALLFTNVKGSKIPVAMNALATRRRIERALGRHARERGRGAGRLPRAHEAADALGAVGLARRRSGAALQARVTKGGRGSGASQQVTEPLDLYRLPVLKCWPGDGGRFFTWPMVLTARSGDRRAQPRPLPHAPVRREDDRHALADPEGRRLPLPRGREARPAAAGHGGAGRRSRAHALGGRAAARGHRRARLRRVPARRADAAGARARRSRARGRRPRPSSCSRASCPPHERRTEGPFGDHFGHYSHAAPFPVFHVKAITRRRNAVYHASFVGKPPQEDKSIGEAVRRPDRAAGADHPQGSEGRARVLRGRASTTCSPSPSRSATRRRACARRSACWAPGSCR